MNTPEHCRIGENGGPGRDVRENVAENHPAWPYDITILIGIKPLLFGFGMITLCFDGILFNHNISATMGSMVYRTI